MKLTSIGRSLMGLSLIALSLFAPVACVKTSAAAVPRADRDLALLRELPGGNIALFGGNYMKMQDFMQSALGSAAQSLMAATGAGDGMHTWITCLSAKHQTVLVGGAALHDDTLALRIAMRGLSIHDAVACAEQAGFAHHVDADGKYASIAVPALGGQQATQAYLQLADGTVYSRLEAELGGVPSFASPTRADLEADVAAARTHSAADDHGLVALATKANRRATCWFAVAGKGTPLAPAIETMYGSITLDSALGLDVVVRLTSDALARRTAQQFAELQQIFADSPQYRGLVRGIQLHRAGASVHVVAKFAGRDLAALLAPAGDRSL